MYKTWKVWFLSLFFLPIRVNRIFFLKDQCPMTVTKMWIFFEWHDRFGNFLQGILPDDRAICVQKDIAIEPFFAEWNLRSMRFQKNLRFPKAFTKLHFLNEVYHYISRFSQETCEIDRPLCSVNFFWYNGKLLTQWRETCDFYLYIFANYGY